MSEIDMVAIPENTPATLDDLQRWEMLKKQIAEVAGPLIAQEKLLRARIVRTFFPKPDEGTNKYPLAHGWQLKLTHSIKREIDMGQYAAMVQVFAENNIPVASLLRTKYELEKKVYSTMTAEQKTLFDQCLIVKPESPQLEIVLPAAEKKKQQAAAALAATPPMPGIQL